VCDVWSIEFNIIAPVKVYIYIYEKILFFCIKINILDKSEIDPGTIFIRKDVQDILINITGFDLTRIFSQRNNKNLDRIVYKYLTDKQLKEVCRYYIVDFMFFFNLYFI